MENEARLPMDLLTSEEAAEYLRLSRRTLEAWREKGEGPEFVKLGRAVRYSRLTIHQFLADSQHRTTSEASKTSRLLRSGKPSS